MKKRKISHLQETKLIDNITTFFEIDNIPELWHSATDSSGVESNRSTQLRHMLQKVDQLKEEQKLSEWMWTYSPRDKCHFDRIAHLLKKFRFETQLTTSELMTDVEKIKVLYNNEELLIFNLQAQLKVYRRWWSTHYTGLGDANIQGRDDYDDYQDRACVSVLEPQFRKCHSWKDIQGIGIDVFQITGLCKNVWGIITNYLTWHTKELCDFCGACDAQEFLQSSLPLKVDAVNLRENGRRKLYGEKLFYFCGGQCAWKFMINNLDYQPAGLATHVLLPCVHHLGFRPWHNRNDLCLSSPLPPFMETKQCAVVDIYNEWDYGCHCFLQYVYSLSHQPDCGGKGCWTYLPRNFL